MLAILKLSYFWLPASSRGGHHIRCQAGSAAILASLALMLVVGWLIFDIPFAGNVAMVALAMTHSYDLLIFLWLGATTGGGNDYGHDYLGLLRLPGNDIGGQLAVLPFSERCSRVDAPEGSRAPGLSSWRTRPLTPSRDMPLLGLWAPTTPGPWRLRTSGMVCRQA